MANRKVSPENKAIAKHVARAFGGSPQVVEYKHDELPISVDLIFSTDRPWVGCTAVSTVGLSDHPMRRPDGSELPVRLEMAGVFKNDKTQFMNVLATTAFAVMRSGRSLMPGAAMLDFVKTYYSDTTVPHLYFTSPFFWQDELKSLDVGPKTVAWLLAVPISDAEAKYLRAHGDNKFETLLAEQDADTVDLYRPSVV